MNISKFFSISSVFIQAFSSLVDESLVIHWLEKSHQKRLAKDAQSFRAELESKLPDLEPEEALALVALIHQQEGVAPAKRYCRQILQKKFAFVPGLWALAYLSFEEKRFDEAQRWFRRALRFDVSERASSSTLYLHQALRKQLNMTEAGRWGLWILKELHENERADEESLFEFGKMLFERSHFEESARVMREVVNHEELGFEAAQYLSYIYERLYSGDDLIEKTLDLAKGVKDRSDLFFNLAMMTQQDETRPELSLALFYLASEADPQDPGLKFSLEQACLEVIGKSTRQTDPRSQFQLMMAHLFHGSMALAKRYAQLLREQAGWRFPESFEFMQPQSLWQEWLLPNEGLFGEALLNWFGDEENADWQRLRKSLLEKRLQAKEEVLSRLSD